jgi:hypothetical protein
MLGAILHFVKNRNTTVTHRIFRLDVDQIRAQCTSAVVNGRALTFASK